MANRPSTWVFLFFAVLSPLCFAELSQQPADLVLQNGRVWAEDDHDTYWAQAIAFRNGSIEKVGSKESIQKYIGPSTRVVDLKGKVVLPGFHDSHVNLFPLPSSLEENLLDSLKEIQKKANALGITSVQGGLIENDKIVKAINALATTKQLTLRFAFWAPLDKLDKFLELEKKYGKANREWFSFEGVYGEIDGDLESQTAVLQESYADKPKFTGEPLITQDRLNELTLAANKAGVSINLRASGDQAVAMAVSSFIVTNRQLFNSRVRNHLFGLELVPPFVYDRFRKLKIVAGIYPNKKDVSDKRLDKKRRKFAYNWQNLVKNKIRLTIGSQGTARDFLDGSLAVNPFYNLYELARKTSVKVAVKAYTWESAYSTHEDHIKGTLRDGKLGDAVVLEKNPFNINIKSARGTL